MTAGRPAWYDVEMRGRRLEAASRQCNTIFHKKIKEGDYELALSYLMGMSRIEHNIQPYVEAMTGVQKFLKKKRKHENTISIPSG